MEVLSRTIGFHEPPCPIRVSWQRRRAFWQVLFQSTHGQFEDPAQVVRWAQSFRPASLEVDKTAVVMRLDDLPPEWQSLVTAFDVDHVELGHNHAHSVLQVRDPNAGLADLKRADADGRAFILEKFAPIRRPKLTPRQRYLLHSALDWGYYDVPRKITLEKMAHRLGVGLNTLSVVLRNAESSLVRNFVLFDEKPLESAKRRATTTDDDPA